ncbi:MAG: carbohydrate ABC transporter permease [Clostridiales bacterium]|jgi:putative aldouronate transport system permease protein|nr:carbohydrate ABC transporter permease [Clostridiales bacterium]
MAAEDSAVAVRPQKDNSIFTVLIYVAVIAFAFSCVFPFLLMLTGSFMVEDDIRRYGYQLIPKQLTTYAYQILFLFPGRILNGYRITLITTITGTLAHLVICSLCAYPLSLKSVKYRRAFQVFILITMVLNGGMVSWYYVCTRMLGLRNTILSMILPLLVSPFNVFLIRGYYMSLPEEMAESATIDGAGQFRIFAQIILPLSKPVLAAVGLFISITFWNDWYHSLMLNDLPEYFSLQLNLRTIVSQVQFLRSNSYAAGMRELVANLPGEGVKLATAMVTVGPIIVIYPFVQKYFVKGIMVGAVKG